MPYCTHDDRERRLLRIDGYDDPQLVCRYCWAGAIRTGDVETTRTVA